MKNDVNQVIIVIPCTDWNEWVLECVKHCDQLEGADFCIWLLPNDVPSNIWQQKLHDLNISNKLHIEPTGPGNPSRKRNVVFRKTSAQILALIDSDAYPRQDWLHNGLALLRDDIAIVTGPNLTPPQDPLLRRVPGRVMESKLGYGAAYIRHNIFPQQYMKEMPTCNMIIRRQEGLIFNEDLDTGEDMTYCSEISARGKKIIYDPEVVIFHHRRKIFVPFIQQFYHYGVNKGVLTRLGSNITYLWHAVPAMLTLYLACAALLNLFPIPALYRWLSVLPLALYFILLLFETVRHAKSLSEYILLPLAFFAAHLGYGFGYLKGFCFPRKLLERLRVSSG